MRFFFVLFVLDAKRTKKVKAEKCFLPHANTPPRLPMPKLHNAKDFV
jgi:hypothetical protein